MSNIHNFTNRMLCEFAGTFPTTAALLDQILFTIGTGYKVDPKSGMIYGWDGQITDALALDHDGWATLISECHEKEHDYAVRFSRPGDPVDPSRIAAACEKYKIVAVTDLNFTEHALYNDIVNHQNTRRAERSVWDETVYYYRPYPLAGNYSPIYFLNENTPEWFLQIALNFVNAWLLFLNEAIAGEDLFKGEEPDYGDRMWTTTHRDAMQQLTVKIKSLMTHGA